MRDERERLEHIREAIERIEAYAARGKEEFRADELIQNWMLRHLQIIGEAARSLSTGFREQHPQVRWQRIIDMRHVLVHQYFGIDEEIVWEVIKRELPELNVQIEALLRPVEEVKRDSEDSG